jgi:hypothetical protein
MVERVMHIDPSFLSPITALFGALAGGSASLAGAVYTQRVQNRLQRAAAEVAKREMVYADFVMSASQLLLDAYLRDDIALSGDEQRLVGLINRMRLFAPAEVIAGAEAVLKAIVGILLKPRIELRQLAMDAVSDGLISDPLLPFSSVCRLDLDRVRTAPI